MCGCFSERSDDRVVYGLADPRCGGCDGDLHIHNHDGLLHKYPVKVDVYEECQFIIQSFFK